MHWYTFDICLEDGTMATDSVPAKSQAEAEGTIRRIYPGLRWVELRATSFASVANQRRPAGTRRPAAPPPPRAGAGAAPAGAAGEAAAPDPYTVLGVARDADAATIKLAWRKALQAYHPDRVAGLGPELIELAERKTRELNAAYEALTRRS